ncbi:hypothetical protein COCCADRAFT_100566 [Bipolaris zeicola 26-R-13]|uniref:Uncharacterized protein n=1 Tax=Cochliobolus carbonum (strain 26-R-13) TaxID=930089 RepID=W6XWE0_COCC2|nr:uncharacterized protein COCCADRAFT_100566 [Bipolaris zeicola 26-R-13]EUC31722.1 hypothetical protein COCCADRAFT_100566 [Bipolaris zeicola 26-R-13]
MTERKSSGRLQPHHRQPQSQSQSQSQSTLNNTTTPPKASRIASNVPKDQARRRIFPLNDMHKHQSGRTPGPSQPTTNVDDSTPPSQDATNESGQQHTQSPSATEKARRDSSNLWESTMNDAVQRESEELVRQNHELRCRVAQLEDQLMYPNSARQHSDRQESPDQVGDLKLCLQAAEKESQERLQQIIALKSSISSLTRVQSQITDSDLVVSLSELANRVREWTISNLRRTKLNLENIPKETEETVCKLYPQYRNGIQGADKFALYQAIISTSLMPIFETPLVFGLPKSLTAIQSFADEVQGSGPAYSEWKRATIQVLENSRVQPDLIREREELLHRILGDICHLLFTLTSTTVTSSAQSALSGILKNAVDFQRTLALQKARYQLLFFRSEGKKMCLDDRTMEAINDVDSTTDDDTPMETDRTFLFCVFPGLVKHGDEWGEHDEMSNVLLKARVCSGFG